MARDPLLMHPSEEPRAFRALMARAGHARSFGALRDKLQDAQRAARAAHETLIRAAPVTGATEVDRSAV